MTLIYFPRVSGQNTGQWFNWSCAPPINSTFTFLSLDWRRRKPLKLNYEQILTIYQRWMDDTVWCYFKKPYFRKNKNRLVKTSIPRETWEKDWNMNTWPLKTFSSKSGRYDHITVWAVYTTICMEIEWNYSMCPPCHVNTVEQSCHC